MEHSNMTVKKKHVKFRGKVIEKAVKSISESAHGIEALMINYDKESAVKRPSGNHTHQSHKDVLACFRHTIFCCQQHWIFVVRAVCHRIQKGNGQYLHCYEKNNNNYASSTRGVSMDWKNLLHPAIQEHITWFQRKYWSEKAGFHNELIVKTMTKKPFTDLSSHLGCLDPAKDLKCMPSKETKEKQDKFNYIRSHALFYIQYIWDTVLEMCCTKYNSLSELSIDEAMMPYRGFKA